jgi:hypothetical protein
MEAALVLALFGLMVSASTPALFAALSRARVAAAARELEQDLARLRAVAVATGRTQAMRLAWSGGGYSFAFYADGDGDGIRADDIAAGRDPRTGGPRDLRSRYEGVDFGLLDAAIPGVPPGGDALAPHSDPVRFGRSDTVSFTPRGSATPGTLYVSDGRSAVVAIVVYGGTGRIRMLAFERGCWCWRR